MQDKTRYIIPHGIRPVEDSTVHFRHMLEQVSTLRSLLSVASTSNLRWVSLTQRFPELDDVVDRLALAESLRSADVRQHLIRLYQAYVDEWNTVESVLSGDLLNPAIDQPTFV
ncbi:hypothetical protein IQ250_12555 [Pseudanabaenaceae cyanobacterium LEGE 13415]|nr:hypothetical protein [Pseudanabaenaceae cyanobacterium LEGE 13415]